jgi:hypothetical protein
MRVTKSTSTAEQIFKTLISMIRNCKKAVDIENQLFAKIGVASITKGQAKILPMLMEFQDYYQDAINIRDLRNTISEDLLKTTAHEYDELDAVLKKYYVNLEVASKVSNIFMESMKKNIARDAKKEYGYNKDGSLVSDQKILGSMPSIKVDNRV